VIGLVCAEDTNTQIMVVSENGYGKRSSIDDYRITNRGGKGVKTINITEKTGALIALLAVKDEEDLMIITRTGVMIRIPIEGLRVMGRNTQGVKLITLRNKQSIAAVTNVEKDEEEEEVEGLEGAEGIDNIEGTHQPDDTENSEPSDETPTEE
jgi:DNA gyrase subunit A